MWISLFIHLAIVMMVWYILGDVFDQYDELTNNDVMGLTLASMQGV